MQVRDRIDAFRNRMLQTGTQEPRILVIGAIVYNKLALEVSRMQIMPVTNELKTYYGMEILISHHNPYIIKVI